MLDTASAVARASAPRRFGVDLANSLTDAAFADIERAFFRAQVLVLRAQSLTPPQFLAFARRFGPPEPHVIDQFHHPADPNILILSNRVKDGQPIGLADAGTYFHTDYSYLDRFRRARRRSIRSRCPRVGGNTLFANQYAAYDDLSDAMKRRIDPLLRHPSLRQPQQPGRDEPHRRVGADRRAEGEDAADHAPARARASGDRPQGALCGVGQLVRHRRHARRRGARRCSTSSPRTRPSRNTSCSLPYGVGDVVIWDNASLLHAATLVDPAHPRTLWRITLKEPAPSGQRRACIAPTFTGPSVDVDPLLKWTTNGVPATAAADGRCRPCARARPCA